MKKQKTGKETKKVESGARLEQCFHVTVIHNHEDGDLESMIGPLGLDLEAATVKFRKGGGASSNPKLRCLHKA